MLTIANPIPAESIKLIVFDLDGTLIDSRRDLAMAVNAMLAGVLARSPELVKSPGDGGAESRRPCGCLRPVRWFRSRSHWRLHSLLEGRREGRWPGSILG